jgi:sugar lactone lactonase YvrE
MENGLRGNSGAGIENRDGLLYHASMYNRRAWVVHPVTWQVHAVWNLPGNRGHGVGWDPSGDGLWISDTNLRAFFRHDTRTGEIVEKIQLTEQDPAIHGVTVHDGYMWYCDDVGYICNFRLS